MRPALRRTWAVASRGAFARFAVAGAVGFVVDGSVLLVLVAGGWAGPIAGRLASFVCALFATFEINRRWSFTGAGSRPYAVLLAAYVGVQGAGFLFNFGVYAAAHFLLPSPLNDPLACLALSSGLALIVNFVGLRRLVFRPRERPLS